MQLLGIGLIGCGGIARSAHLPALAALRQRTVLRAVADLDAAAAARAAEPFGAAADTDYRALLDRREVEAVIIATPEAVHEQQVIAAAEAGKHVLCEKPMARTLREADAMIAACWRAGVTFMVGHSRRFTRRYMHVADMIGKGEIGSVRLVRENERRPKGFGPGGEATFTPAHWTGDPETNLGVALLAGVHEADVLRWFVGEEPVSVYARHAVTTPGNIGVPDFLSFTVRFAGGAIGASEISRMPPVGYPACHQLELFGTTGAIRARDHDLISVVRYRAGGADFPGSTQLFLSGGHTYARQLSEFTDAIRTDHPPPVSPQDARAALAVALATIESGKLGRPVALSSELAAGAA